jgi:hypothetical protein
MSKIAKTDVKRLLGAILFVFLLPSCGDNGAKENSNSEHFIKPKKEIFETIPKENTEVVSGKVMRSLKSYDTKTGTYVFKDDAEGIEDLKPGTVVLFETHSLRKIKSVKKEGENLIVTSEFAQLTDYYKDAKISYEAPINWSKGTASSYDMKFGQPIVTMASPMLGLANSSQMGDVNVHYEDEIAGWKVEFELEPMEHEKLKVKLKAEKDGLCSIVAEGFISSFISEADIVIENGTTQHFSYHNRNLDGELEIKFAASGLGSEVAILEIPAQLERTILVYGVIPVTLRLKANLKIYPEVAPGSTSQVSMKYRYNSSLGFVYQGTSLTSSGDITNDHAEQTGDSNTATVGIAGMGVGVEFPRVELGILGNIVVPYVVHNMHASTYLSTGLLDGNPCHRASCKFEVHAGVSMRFLGVGSINNDYKIGERIERWVVPGSHCGD